MTLLLEVHDSVLDRSPTPKSSLHKSVKRPATIADTHHAYGSTSYQP